MKRVIESNELNKIMDNAIDMLCNPVISTLGPKGSNVIISDKMSKPYISNDGVSIARSITSNDLRINAILEIAKEASIKSEEDDGDGTTTTLCLLKKLYYEIKKYLDKYSFKEIKDDINKEVEKIIDLIDKNSFSPNDKQLYKIACISGNSKEIGSNVIEAYNKVLDCNAIMIKEGNSSKTIIKYYQGYKFDSSLRSDFFLKNDDEIVLDDVSIYLMDNVDDINDLKDIINSKKNSVVISEYFSDDVVNMIVSSYLDGDLKIILLDVMEYGTYKYEVLKDIDAIKDNVIDIRINSDSTIIKFKKDSNIDKYIFNLEDRYKNNDNNKEFYQRRLLALNNGFCDIYVGAKTDVERKELKLRYQDSVNSLKISKNKVVVGGGLIYYKISGMLSNTVGGLILKETLKSPIYKILDNAMLDSDSIMKKIRESNYKVVYNVLNDKYEDISDTEVLDAKDILVNSLKNAISICLMLVSTKYLVINDDDVIVEEI